MKISGMPGMTNAGERLGKFGGITLEGERGVAGRLTGRLPWFIERPALLSQVGIRLKAHWEWRSRLTESHLYSNVPLVVTPESVGYLLGELNLEVNFSSVLGSLMKKNSIARIEIFPGTSPDLISDFFSRLPETPMPTQTSQAAMLNRIVSELGLDAFSAELADFDHYIGLEKEDDGFGFVFLPLPAETDFPPAVDDTIKKICLDIDRFGLIAGFNTSLVKDRLFAYLEILLKRSTADLASLRDEESQIIAETARLLLGSAADLFVKEMSGAQLDNLVNKNFSSVGLGLFAKAIEILKKYKLFEMESSIIDILGQIPLKYLGLLNLGLLVDANFRNGLIPRFINAQIGRVDEVLQKEGNPPLVQTLFEKSRKGLELNLAEWKELSPQLLNFSDVCLSELERQQLEIEEALN